MRDSHHADNPLVTGNGFSPQRGELLEPPWWCGCPVETASRCETCERERAAYLEREFPNKRTSGMCCWGCERPVDARWSQRDPDRPRECEACTRQALRKGRDRQGRPIRATKGVA